MRLVQWRNKWVLYDVNGKVIIITTLKSICERMVKEWQEK
jgi:hypothetical protein